MHLANDCIAFGVFRLNTSAPWINISYPGAFNTLFAPGGDHQVAVAAIIAMFA